MKYAYAVALTALLAPNAWTGEAVQPVEFKDARKATPEVLRNVSLKGVVTQFLDPESTGLGKSLALLAWRETLTAIADQAEAGVIVATSGEPSLDLLPTRYHEAAVAIAKNQKARLCLWGAVEQDGEGLLIDTYLAVLTEHGVSDLELRLEAPPGELAASLGRTRFNLSPVHSSRRELFERPLILELSRAVLRKSPSTSAPAVQQAPIGSLLWAVDMTGDGWFKLRLPGGSEAYVDARTHGLRVPPRYVEASSKAVNLRAGPGKGGLRVARQDLEGSYKVLDLRFKEGSWWYRIALGDKDAWVAAWLVRPRYSLPVVHLLAGLYRYYGQRYREASAELEQFISSGPESNVNLAAAEQILGASRLLGRDGGDAWAAFSRALEWTPYDSRAYLARSVAGIGLRRPEDALGDVAQALKLDPADENARRLAVGLLKIASTGEGAPREQMWVAEFTQLRPLRPKVEAMVAKYDITPQVE